MPVLRDVRYALRLLARTPGSTLLTILVLAGGLGISTFAFSFLHTAMVRPIPLADGDRIVRLMTIDQGRRRQVDEADLAELRAMRTVSDMAAYTRRDVLIGREGQTRALTVAAVDPALFAIARTAAAHGRTLVPADAAPGAEPVIVLSHRAWRVAFGQSGAIVDRRVTINGVETRVAGIMPEGFGFPVAEDAWMPLPAPVATVPPGTSFLSVAARLGPGVGPEEAAAEATTILRRSMGARARPGEPAATAAALVDSFPAAQFGEERNLLFGALNGIAALILLLSVVNAATLLTARANERIRETAVRLALGASSARIVVQGMWEGTLLCLAGGVLGTAGAAWGLGAITRWTRANIEENLAFWWVWEADRTTVLGGAAFVVLAIAALGGLVSVRAARVNVREVMQDGTLGAGSRRSGRLARGLVVTQVATVTVLMFVGVLSAVMAQRVLTLDLGYDPARLLQVGVEPGSVPRFGTVDARDRLFADLQARLAGHGAIDGALLRTTLATRDAGRFAAEGTESATLPVAHVLAALGDLAVIDVRPVAGRLLTGGDDRSQAPVVLISQSLALRHWPGRLPIGERLRLASVGDGSQWRTIVGVVTDLPFGNPFDPDRSTEAIYVPLRQSPATGAQAYVRYRSTEAAAREALYQVLGEADPALTPRAVHRSAEVLQKAGFLTVALAKLFGACFAFALLLAVAGTYGLMSTAIGQRTREIGVRRALGASDGVATRLLLTQGARQLGIGTLIAAPVVGVLGFAATRLLPIGGPLTAAVGMLVSAAVIAVVLGATWVPIRKALRTPLRTALLRES